MAEENRRGFHHREQLNFEHGHERGQGRMEPPNQGRVGMKDPSNHNGPTGDMARTREHQGNVERMRGAHAAHHGYREHEKILHDTHKLHNGDYTSHGNKHGEAHHVRQERQAQTEGE